MKVYALLILVLFNITGYSQASINSYKYVLVSEKFDFSKFEDQYGLNTTAKQLLEQKGFVAFMGNDPLPLILAANKCNALKAEVVQKRGLFVTNLTLLLKDCQGNIIFRSKEGKSREKEYPVAYDLALRDAFSSLNDLPYKYDSTIGQQMQQVAAAPAPATSLSAPTPAAALSAPVSATAAPVLPGNTTGNEIAGALYAQVTATGYQLVDTTPKKVLSLFKTSVPDYFIAENGASNGIVFKRNGEWFFEHYEDNKLVSRKLEIKF